MEKQCLYLLGIELYLTITPVHNPNLAILHGFFFYHSRYNIIISRQIKNIYCQIKIVLVYRKIKIIITRFGEVLSSLCLQVRQISEENTLKNKECSQLLSSEKIIPGGVQSPSLEKSHR